MAKAISPVVAVALLLVVTVSAAVGFQTWYNTYSSEILTEIENEDTINTMRIDKIVGNSLYVYSVSAHNISSIKVRDVSGDLVCDFENQSNLDGQVFHLNFDNKNSTHFYDMSGTGNHGEMTDVTITGGRVGQAYGGIINTSQVTLIDSPSLSSPSSTGELTFLFWINFNSLDYPFNNVNFFRKNGGGITEYMVSYRHLNTRFRFYVENSSIADFSQLTHIGWNVGRWEHLTVKYNSTTKNATWYLNGVNLQSNILDIQDELADGIGDLVIPERDNDDIINITYDEMIMYNRTLSDREVSNIYYFNSLNLSLGEGYNTLPIPGCNLTKKNKYDIVIDTGNKISQATIVPQ